MASTGTQTTWSSNGGFYLKIVWNITSQSVANNRSMVRARMYIGAKSGWSLSDSSNSWALNINGTNFTGSNVSVNINGSERLMAEESVMVNHNSDGTKNIIINGSVAGFYFGGINPSGFTASLDAIPRASTISSTASLNAENNSNIGITRYSSNFSHTLDIFLTRSGVADKYIKQLSYSSSVTSRGTAWDSSDRLKMFEDGHGYWTGTKLVLKTFSGGSLVGTTEKTGSFTYPSINSVGSISGFTLGSAAPVSISKASDLYSHQIEVRIGSTVIGSQAISTGTDFNVTINSTSVLNSITTSKTGTAVLWIKTFLSTNSAVVIRDWTSEASATVTIPASYAPSFAATQFTFADTNTAIVNITGSNQTLVSGLSTLQVSINTAAVATTGASIVSYQVAAGNKSGSRADIGAVALGAIDTSSSSVSITVTAVDSRGFQTSVNKSATVIPYQKPTVVGNATRNGGFEETTVIRTSGVINRLVVGGTAKNTLTSLQYRTKLSTATWGTTWTPIPFTAPTGTNTTYTASNVTLTIPSLEAWNIEVKAVDTMGSITSVIYTVPAGVPLVFMDTTLNSIGIGTFPVSSNELRVAGGMVGTRLNVTNHALDSDGLSGHGTSFIRRTGTRLVLNSNNGNSGGILLTGDTEIAGSTTITGSATISSGSVSAALMHTGGYFRVNSFSSTWGVGQGELWYSANDRRFNFGSRNSGESTSTTASIMVDGAWATAFRAPGTSIGYLQTAGAEFRVTDHFSTSSYKAIRASNVTASSSIRYKSNLEPIDSRVNALELIKQTEVWHYHLKSHLEALILDKPKVGVISEMANPLIRDEDGIDPYSMVSIAWRAIQQQDEKIQAQQTEIEALKEQNQALLAMVMDLTARIEALEQ